MAKCTLTTEFGHLAGEHLDVREIVNTAQLLLRLSRPLFVLWRLITEIIWWEKRSVCITLLAACNVLCIFMPPVYVTIAVIVVIAGVALLGVSHRNYQLLVKVFPSADAIRGELSVEEQSMSHHERMQEFRLLLMVFHAILKRCVALLNSFYLLLKWDNLHFSLKCHVVLACAVLLLRAMPLRLSGLLVLDIILLFKPVYQCVNNWKQQRNDVVSSATLPTCTGDKMADVRFETVTAEDAISLNSEMQIDGGIGTESDISDTENQKPLDDSSSGDDADSVASFDVQQPSGDSRDSKSSATTSRAPGVVGRLLELKRRKQPLNEKCSGCHVIFTTILKRRHICSHCGNHFCSRCCSHRVPRSTFGATAPAAQTETVAVCINCYTVLTNTAAAAKPKAS